MQNICNLFDLSRTFFLPIAAMIILVCVLISITRARNLAQYYNFPYDNYDGILPSDTEVVVIDSKTGRKRPLVDFEKIARQRRLFDIAVTSSLVLFIIAALSFNMMILLINASAFGSNFSLHGIIPYIFKSNSMQPAIMLNDLTFFKQIEDGKKIGIGEIILFEENNLVYVERVIAKKGSAFQVDIDYYPPLSEAGAMIKVVAPEKILSPYHARSRWLGALILFAVHNPPRGKASN
jgi:hypothetical protein